MDSGPLVPLNGQILRELQPPFPIEFNRNAAPAPIPAFPRRILCFGSTCGFSSRASGS